MNANSTAPICITMLACVIALGTPATADPVSDFYTGKTVTMTISTGVGGGVDLNARIVARHLGNHIPGRPNVVPQNMTGAGHLQATNYLYNAAPKDGTAIGVILAAFVGYQVLDGKGVQYDARKFNWIGSSDVDNANLYVWSETGVRSIADVTSRQVLMGATGAGSYTVLYPTLLNNTLGTKFKVVAGYKSTNEIGLAIERGEVEGRAGDAMSSLRANKPAWIANKKIAMLVQIGAKRDPDWPDTPLLTELARTPEEQEIYEVFSAEIALGRPFLAPPGVPTGRLAALRQAFVDTMEDPSYIEEAQRAGIGVRPLGFDEAKSIADRIVSMPKEIIAKARTAIEARRD